MTDAKIVGIIAFVSFWIGFVFGWLNRKAQEK